MARSLLDMVVKREKLRRESLLLDHLVFEQRILARTMTKRLGLPAEVIEEAKAQRKRALKLRGLGSPSPNKHARSARKRKMMDGDDFEMPKDPLTLAIENDIRQRQVKDAEWDDMTDGPFLRLPRHPAHSYLRDNPFMQENDFLSPNQIRYRIGRGGRLLIDRHLPPSSRPRSGKWKYDDFENSTDDEMVESIVDSVECVVNVFIQEIIFIL